MSQESSDPGVLQVPLGWRVTWVLVFVLASALPFLHWHYEAAEIIEPLRHPWGLLPAHWLMFRWSGEIATYALFFVAFSGVWAWRQPAHAKSVILLATVVALVAAVASAMLTARLMVTFIHEESLRTPEERIRLNMGAGPTPQNTKPSPAK